MMQWSCHWLTLETPDYSMCSIVTCGRPQPHQEISIANKPAKRLRNLLFYPQSKLIKHMKHSEKSLSLHINIAASNANGLFQTEPKQQNTVYLLKLYASVPFLYLWLVIIIICVTDDEMRVRRNLQWCKYWASKTLNWNSVLPFIHLFSRHPSAGNSSFIQLAIVASNTAPNKRDRNMFHEQWWCEFFFQTSKLDRSRSRNWFKQKHRIWKKYRRILPRP